MYLQLPLESGCFESKSHDPSKTSHKRCMRVLLSFIFNFCITTEKSLSGSRLSERPVAKEKSAPVGYHSRVVTDRNAMIICT